MFRFRFGLRTLIVTCCVVGAIVGMFVRSRLAISTYSYLHRDCDGFSVQGFVKRQWRRRDELACLFVEPDGDKFGIGISFAPGGEPIGSRCVLLNPSGIFVDGVKAKGPHGERVWVYVCVPPRGDVRPIDVSEQESQTIIAQFQQLEHTLVWKEKIRPELVRESIRAAVESHKTRRYFSPSRFATHAELMRLALRSELASQEGRIHFDVAGVIASELARIPAGTFWLGSPETEGGRQANEGPRRQIKITRPFYLGRQEVTREQFASVMGTKLTAGWSDTPVSLMSYAEVHEFLRKLSQLTGVKVTLPTEAQWEYACRAGTQTAYYTGESPRDINRAGQFDLGPAGRPQRVASMDPNAFGLYDMHGNAWEPCRDFLPAYDKIDEADPVGEISADSGALRGGSWKSNAEDCRAARRIHSDSGFAEMGIRICINPDDLEIDDPATATHQDEHAGNLPDANPPTSRQPMK